MSDNVMVPVDDKEYQAAYRARNKERRNAANREYRKRPEVMARNRLQNRKKAKLFPSWYLIRNRVYKGKLKRQPCTYCGAQNGLAHHEDYAKPLAIVWVCHQHHKDIHAGKIKVRKKDISHVSQ